MAKKEKPAPRDSRDFVEHIPRGGLPYQTFDEFWSLLRRERGLKPSLKTHVWTHFKAIGILNEPSRYEDGLRSFGL